MKKIKSAAELALEKTKTYAHASKDTETSDENREYLKAAEVLAASLLDNKTAPEKAVEALEKYPDKAKVAVTKLFFQKFADGINFKNTPAVLRVLKHLAQDEVLLNTCTEVNQIYEEYDQKMEQKKQNAADENSRMMLQKLAQEGIKGTAIYKVNVRESDFNESVCKPLEEEYNRQLSGFRSFLAGKAREKEV